MIDEHTRVHISSSTCTCTQLCHAYDASRHERSTCMHSIDTCTHRCVAAPIDAMRRSVNSRSSDTRLNRKGKRWMEAWAETRPMCSDEEDGACTVSAHTCIISLPHLDSPSTSRLPLPACTCARVIPPQHIHV